MSAAFPPIATPLFLHSTVRSMSIGYCLSLLRSRSIRFISLIRAVTSEDNVIVEPVQADSCLNGPLLLRKRRIDPQARSHQEYPRLDIVTDNCCRLLTLTAITDERDRVQLLATADAAAVASAIRSSSCDRWIADSMLKYDQKSQNLVSRVRLSVANEIPAAQRGLFCISLFYSLKVYSS